MCVLSNFGAQFTSNSGVFRRNASTSAAGWAVFSLTKLLHPELRVSSHTPFDDPSFVPQRPQLHISNAYRSLQKQVARAFYLFIDPCSREMMPSYAANFEIFLPKLSKGSYTAQFHHKDVPSSSWCAYLMDCTMKARIYHLCPSSRTPCGNFVKCYT